MTMKVFSPVEAIKFGWKACMDNWVFFASYTVVLLAISGLFGSNGALHAGDFVAFLANVVTTVLGVFFIKACLRTVDGQPANWDNVFSGVKPVQVGNYFLGTIVLGIGLSIMLIPVFFVAGGSLMYAADGPSAHATGNIIMGILISIPFIIPGLIFLMTYGQFQYGVIDVDAGPLEALQHSAQITRGQRLNLFYFMLLSLAVIALGFACLIVGMVLALPVVGIAAAYVYRKLDAGVKAQSVAPPEAEEKPVNAAK
jgi:hypothetical protein